MAKTFIDKLMADDEGKKLYFREDLIFEITETICKVMQEKDINKAQLSRLAGVSKSNITQLLSGDHNMQLTTIADLLYALDSKLSISAVPLDIESIVGGADSLTTDQWLPSADFATKQIEYQEISQEEDEKKEFTQAA